MKLSSLILAQLLVLTCPAAGCGRDTAISFMRYAFTWVYAALCLHSLCIPANAEHATRLPRPGAAPPCEFIPFGKTVRNHPAADGWEGIQISADGRFRVGKNDIFYRTIKDLKTGLTYPDRLNLSTDPNPSKLLSVQDRKLLVLHDRGLWLSPNRTAWRPSEEAKPPNELVRLGDGIMDYDVRGHDVIETLDATGKWQVHKLKESGLIESSHTQQTFSGAIAGAFSKDQIAVVTPNALTLFSRDGKSKTSYPLGSFPLDPPPRLAFSSDGKSLSILFANFRVWQLTPLGSIRVFPVPKIETNDKFEILRLSVFQGGNLLQVASSFDSDLILAPTTNRAGAKLIRHSEDVGRADEFTKDGKTYFSLPARRGFHPSIVEGYRLECIAEERVADPQATVRDWLKAGAFQPERDLGKLLYLVRHHPELRACLQTAQLELELYSDVAATRLSEMGEEASATKKTPAPLSSCMVPKDAEGHWRARLQQMLKLRLEDFGGSDEYYWRGSSPSEWKFLALYPDLVRLLSSEDREALRERIARSVALEPGRIHHEVSSVSPALARELASDALAHFFQLPSERTAEIQLFEGSGHSSTYLKVFSTENVEGRRAQTELAPSPFRLLLSEVPLTFVGERLSADVRIGSDVYEARGKLGQDVAIASEIPYEQVEPLVLDKKSCKFFSESSNSVKDGILRERLISEPDRSDRVVIVKSPETVLKDCETLRKRVGPEGCANLEFAGHGAGGCGVSGIFSLSGLAGQLSHDAEEFDRIIACFRSLIPADKPIIFTSCGGYGKQQTRNMFRMASRLDRQVIAANGKCSSDGWGAYSKDGWLSIPRLPKDKVEKFEDATLKITRKK